jgi:hypothetical protein
MLLQGHIINERSTVSDISNVLFPKRIRTFEILCRKWVNSVPGEYKEVMISVDESITDKNTIQKIIRQACEKELNKTSDSEYNNIISLDKQDKFLNKNLLSDLVSEVKKIRKRALFKHKKKKKELAKQEAKRLEQERNEKRITVSSFLGGDKLITARDIAYKNKVAKEMEERKIFRDIIQKQIKITRPKAKKKKRKKE